jgi:hypothetical protein
MSGRSILARIRALAVGVRVQAIKPIGAIAAVATRATVAEKTRVATIAAGLSGQHAIAAAAAISE